MCSAGSWLKWSPSCTQAGGARKMQEERGVLNPSLLWKTWEELLNNRKAKWAKGARILGPVLRTTQLSMLPTHVTAPAATSHLRSRGFGLRLGPVEGYGSFKYSLAKNLKLYTRENSILQRGGEKLPRGKIS